MGQAHHVVVALYSTYLTYYSCYNELGLASPSEKGGSFTKSGEHWGWWKDENCFMEFNKGYAYNIMISMSYMTVEYLIISFQIEKPTTLNQQMKMHHIMATSGYTLSLFAGYGYPGVSNASLFCEYSSIFLNYKDMFTKDTRNTPLGQINQLCFFFGFTFFRVCLFPFLVYRCFAVTMLAFHLVNWFRKFCMIFCCIQSFCVLLLNLYWYKLILKGLKRLLEEKGILKKPEDQAYDDLDQYEACATTELVSKEDTANEGGDDYK